MCRYTKYISKSETIFYIHTFFLTQAKTSGITTSPSNTAQTIPSPMAEYSSMSPKTKATEKPDTNVSRVLHTGWVRKHHCYAC